MVFLEQVENKKILTISKLNQYFLTAIDLYKNNCDKTLKTTLFNILEDYYSAEKFLNTIEQPIKREFNLFIFVQVLAKIKAIGIIRSALENETYIKARLYLVKEIENMNLDYAKKFEELLSDNFNFRNSLDSLRILNKMIAHFQEIFVNTHQYRKMNILNNIRIAKSFLAEYENSDQNLDDKNVARVIYQFLNQLVEEYILEGFRS